MIYEKKSFGSEVVPLDGNTFKDCKFDGTRLVYSGGNPPTLNGCNFNKVSFDFDGPAGNTVGFLKAMAAPVSGMQHIVRQTFPSLGGH